MKAPGVIVNARARRVAQDPALIERLRRLVPAGNLCVTHEPDEIVSAVQALHACGVECLVLVGGDGSLMRTLTPLVQTWPDLELPRVLLAGGGTVNTVARSLGVRGRPDHVLERLMDPTARPREDPRPLLRIRTGDDAPRYGIIFVSGAGPRFLEFYYAESSRGLLGAAYSVAASLASIATAGPLGRKLFAPFDAQVEVDGERLPLERFTVMLASSIRDIGLGFRPFRTAGERIDRLHWIASDMGGVELGLRLLPLRLGVPDALGPVPQGPARCLTIHTPEPMPFTIDAELFPGGHTLSVEVGPLIRFLVV